MCCLYASLTDTKLGFLVSPFLNASRPDTPSTYAHRVGGVLCQGETGCSGQRRGFASRRKYDTGDDRHLIAAAKLSRMIGLGYEDNAVGH